MALLDTAVNVQKGAASAPYVLARGLQYDNDGDYRKAFLDYLTYDSLMNNNATADFYYTKYKCEMKIRQYQPALNDIAHAIVLTRTEPLYYAEMASLQLRVNKLEDAVKTCDLALRSSETAGQKGLSRNTRSNLTFFLTQIVKSLKIATLFATRGGLPDLPVFAILRADERPTASLCSRPFKCTDGVS